MFLYTDEKIYYVFRRLQLHFPKASILKLTDLPHMCMDITIFYKIFYNWTTLLTVRCDPDPRFEKPDLRHHGAAFSPDKVGMLVAFRPHVSTNTTCSPYCGHSTFTCLPSSQDNMILTPFCRSLALTAIFFRLYSFGFVEHPSPTVTELKQQYYFIACVSWHRV